MVRLGSALSINFRPCSEGKVNPSGRTMSGLQGSLGHPGLQRWTQRGSTSHTRCVTLGKFLKLPESQFPLLNEGNSMNLMG